MPLSNISPHSFDVFIISQSRPQALQSAFPLTIFLKSLELESSITFPWQSWWYFSYTLLSFIFIVDIISFFFKLFFQALFFLLFYSSLCPSEASLSLSVNFPWQETPGLHLMGSASLADFIFIFVATFHE